MNDKINIRYLNKIVRDIYCCIENHAIIQKYSIEKTAERD